MMLLYKAWRESRVRFGIMVLVLSWACLAVVLMQQTVRAHSDEPMTYGNFVWAAVYKGAVRDLFLIMGMMLGLGGLTQERVTGTAGFTLALPVARSRVVLTRAAVGFLELMMLAILPAILFPTLSPLVGASYPLPQALQFGVLWAAGGAIPYAATFFLSVLFAGEYSAWVVCVASMTVYTVVIYLPPLVKFPSLDFLRLMNGSQTSYFRSADSTLIGPLPWLALATMFLIAFAFVSAAQRVTDRRDFS